MKGRESSAQPAKIIPSGADRPEAQKNARSVFSRAHEPPSSQSCAMAFDAPDSTLYNSSIDKLSRGAQHAKAWKEYKQHGTLGRDEVDDEKDREEGVGSDDDADEPVKVYGKRYPRVWTKGAHGGKYKISMGPGARTGYDALEQNPDGSALTVAPGYEKPDSGATTNFVGNHMTQGAIDLVQNELTRPDPDGDTRMARLDAARGIKRMPPRLLAPDELGPASIPSLPTVTRPVERYAWADDDDELVVVVRLGDLLGVPADIEGAKVTSEPSGGEEREPRTPLVVVIPDVGGGTDSGSVLTLRLAGGVDEWTMVKNKDEVRLAMVKSESSRGRWKTLRAQEVISLGTKDDSRTIQPPPDLAALRRQILERREGKLANQLPWFGDNNRKFLAAAAAEDDAAPGADVEAVGDPMDALMSGQELAAQGKHAEASVFFSRGIELIADEGDPRACAKLHAARARAREHLGNLRAAEQDHTATLTAVERGGAVEPEGVDACSALLARGRCRMQLEDYVAACEDFTDALRSNPSSRAASEALRDAKRLADQQSSAREKEAKCAKDMPVLFAKPGLRQFEPRGKAGSAF